MCVNLFIKNRLISIDDKIEYQYNNNNRRVSKTVNGTTTYFIYEGHKLMGEYDKDGNIIKEYFYFGNTPIAMIDSIDIYNIYSDHLSTPRRVTNSKNKTVWKWESTPFGETAPTGSLEFNLRFAGQYYDNETGTHYNINRDYNPVTGRYIQSDPIGLDGGFSTFVYVNGNPVMLVDLEGLFLASQNVPTPVSVESYTEQMMRLWNDIRNSQVSIDIKNMSVLFQYDSALYGSLGGARVAGLANATKDSYGNNSGKGGAIIIYRIVWETESGKRNIDDANYELVFTMLHELQHLRKYNNDHPKHKPYYPPFNDAVTHEIDLFSKSQSSKSWI